MASRLLFLARHGEQDRPADGQGGPDGASGDPPEVGLSARGRRQAELLGERLRGVPFAAVHHGPLPRAAQTAGLVARSLPGVPVHATELAGDHLPHDTDPADLPPAYARLLAAYSPAERVDGPRLTAAAVARFAAVPADGDDRMLVVTHAFLIAWLVRHAMAFTPGQRAAVSTNSASAAAACGGVPATGQSVQSTVASPTLSRYSKASEQRPSPSVVPPSASRGAVASCRSRSRSLPVNRPVRRAPARSTAVHRPSGSTVTVSSSPP
ncbi:histidine phosphatase family protein [Micromonospora carbonacea]|uniref:histidine phosphatase family protein n=1 Tax=Micromonospora carbonacea TaxID=47853 RepID=UPI0037223CD5